MRSGSVAHPQPEVRTSYYTTLRAGMGEAWKIFSLSPGCFPRRSRSSAGSQAQEQPRGEKQCRHTSF